MNIPGFVAETSLYKKSIHYTIAEPQVATSIIVEVFPQQINRSQVSRGGNWSWQEWLQRTMEIFFDCVEWLNVPEFSPEYYICVNGCGDRWHPLYDACVTKCRVEHPPKVRRVCTQWHWKGPFQPVE